MRVTIWVTFCWFFGTHLRIFICAVFVEFTDVVLLHPPPGVLRVPVWGSFDLAADVPARAAEDERLSARVHTKEPRHIVDARP